MVLGLLRLWVLWRIARVAVPLLLVLALVSALGRQAHSGIALPTPRAAAPLTRVLGRDTDTLIDRLRRQLTATLQRGASRR